MPKPEENLVNLFDEKTVKTLPSFAGRVQKKELKICNFYLRKGSRVNTEEVEQQELLQFHQAHPIFPVLYKFGVLTIL